MKKLLVSLLFVTSIFVTQDKAVAATHPEVNRWKQLALSVGWTKNEWNVLKCIMWRESRGNPNAYNGRDPAGGSRGLLQINGINTKALVKAKIIRWPSDLYNPRRNLRAAEWLHDKRGWKPWGGRC